MQPVRPEERRDDGRMKGNKEGRNQRRKDLLKKFEGEKVDVNLRPK